MCKENHPDIISYSVKNLVRETENHQINVAYAGLNISEDRIISYLSIHNDDLYSSNNKSSPILNSLNLLFLSFLLVLLKYYKTDPFFGSFLLSIIVLSLYFDTLVINDDFNRQPISIFKSIILIIYIWTFNFMLNLF